MNSRHLGLALIASLAVSTAAQAALHTRAGGMVYDDDLNITWLANANYAATELTDARRDAIIAAVGSVAGHTLATADFFKSGAAYTGQMTWWGAMAWADQLVYGGFSDWRLPTTLQPDPSCSDQIDFGPPLGVQSFGSNCTGSEMGHLFYSELGGTAGSSILTSSDPDLSKFTNIQPGVFQPGVYWSGTELAPGTSVALDFTMGGGYQNASAKRIFSYAWAVRPGDVAAVPEPGSLALAMAALAGLGWAGRRRRG